MNHAIHLLKQEQDRLRAIKPANHKDWVETESQLNDIELLIRLYKVYLAEWEVLELVKFPVRISK